MSNTAQPKVPRPETLEAKFKLLAALPYDRRVGRKHSLVFGFILDWWHSKYGDALASVRHIMAQLKERDPSGRGLFAGDVHSALNDLVRWGYLSQEKGVGRRASRYIPVWSRLDSVREGPNATVADSSVLESPNAGVLESPNATAASVLESPNEDPSTRTRSLDRSTGVDGHDSAKAPPDSGAGAPGGADALDGFEKLWRAYGFRRQKAEARREYNRLGPDSDTQASMVAAADAWRSAWEAQGKPDAPRKHLHSWLREESYDCDPPGRLARTQPTTEQVVDENPDGHYEVVETSISRTGDTTYVQLKIRRDEDVFNEFWNISPDDPWNQRRAFEDMARSIGVENVTQIIPSALKEEDLATLRFRPFRADKLNLGWRFYPRAANDNERPEKAAAA